MLANKYHLEEDPIEPDKTPGFKNKIMAIDPEKWVENMTNVMFKAILIFGIPYFLFVLIKFLSL